jgi:predicted heme/steroid binding protein
MPNKNLIIAIGVVGLCVIVGIWVFAFDTQKNNTSSTIQTNNTTSNQVSNTSNNINETKKVNFNNSELSKFNGLNGNKCYAAVDGVVYDLSNFSLWRNGVHSPSGGQASCGKDLSSVINNASHGKGKLRIVPVVGDLVN